MAFFSPRFLAFLLLAGIALLIARENLTRRPAQLYQTTSGRVEMCLACHGEVELDPAHSPKMLGCSPCHLGQPMAIGKAEAHAGLVKNPGDLRVVERSCGIEGCHPTDVQRVKNSLMATNRGIIATLLYYWGEAPDQNGDYSVEQLLTSGQTSLALDYFRKLCATCHLWKEKGDLPGFFGEKGGGCSACHFLQEETAVPAGGKKKHPWISKKVPVKNCVRCHNRSGRIGISYTGVYESEGYGTPYAQGEHSANRLPGGRFYLDIPADIHYQRGLACIDCHTRNELMGDGKRHAHYEEQLEIRCQSCHATAKVGVTEKKNLLNNVAPGPDKVPVLTGKLDGKIHPLTPPKPGVCDYESHRRLSCQSCHSTWVPQCYGCHVKQDKSETHLDKLTMKETPGGWEEGRSYLRYERPALALWADRVVTVTPGCQDIVTVVNEKGDTEKTFNRFTMAAIDPHTTQGKGLSCPECHASTKAVGLGSGTAWRAEGQWRFQGVDQGVTTAGGPTPPLDAYVAIDGTPLQKSFRANLRPFNGEELGRILRVGQCLACHTSPDDPVYHPYRPENRCGHGRD